MHIESGRRSQLRFTSRRESAQRRARRQREESVIIERETEVQFYKMGEPSGAFYPAPDNVIFLADLPKTRKQIRREREQLLLDAEKTLADLIKEQKKDKIEKQNLITGNDWVSIFTQYVQTDLYSETMLEASSEVKKGADVDELTSGMAGKMFEDICYGLLSNTDNESSILLSPEKSYTLTKSIFPQGELFELPFGHNFIRDKGKAYVPDGYSVNINEDPIIEMVLEYTLNPLKRTMFGQVKRFNQVKRKFPELFSKNCLFVLVNPGDSQSTGLEHRKNVKVLPAPFSKTEFGRQVEGIWTGD